MIRLQGQYNMQRTPSVFTDTFKGSKISGSDRQMNQDKINIRADGRQIMEKEFASRTAHDILLEVVASPSEKRLGELERQIAQGTYQVDVAAIAEKLFRYGGM